MGVLEEPSKVKATEPRKLREKQFHDNVYGNVGRIGTSKYYSIARSSREFYLNELLCSCKGKHVLECGCGRGYYACLTAKHGGKVTGIDISDVSVLKAWERARKDGVEDKVIFETMDLESMTFEEDSFDVVCGTGVLHHLNLERAFRELSRVLKPEGNGLFLEPLGHNPLINFYRKLTPQMRTPDEHPLLMKDLKLAEQYFHNVKLEYFHLLSLCAVPFRNMKGFHRVLKVLDRSDSALFALLPCLKPYSWSVLLNLSKPVKNL